MRPKLRLRFRRGVPQGLSSVCPQKANLQSKKTLHAKRGGPRGIGLELDDAHVPLQQHLPPLGELRRKERGEVLLDEGEDEHVADGRQRRDEDGGEQREREQVARRAPQRQHLALLQRRALPTKPPAHSHGSGALLWNASKFGTGGRLATVDKSGQEQAFKKFKSPKLSVFFGWRFASFGADRRKSSLAPHA